MNSWAEAFQNPRDVIVGGLCQCKGFEMLSSVSGETSFRLKDIWLGKKSDVTGFQSISLFCVLYVLAAEVFSRMRSEVSE